MQVGFKGYFLAQKEGFHKTEEPSQICKEVDLRKMDRNVGLCRGEITMAKTGSIENDIKLATYFIKQRFPFNYSPSEEKD
ncbi:MAG: hypothetical protein A2Y25_00860 [Candidatus Melainabacteria bacterium GWF2_37_15]|nr:MAG: hypothetical protein A2Y25_00860 [Candidatus Melainabacteria bacterium GWF2_37_15]